MLVLDKAVCATFLEQEYCKLAFGSSLCGCFHIEGNKKVLKGCSLWKCFAVVDVVTVCALHLCSPWSGTREAPSQVSVLSRLPGALKGPTHG